MSRLSSKRLGSIELRRLLTDEVDALRPYSRYVKSDGYVAPEKLELPKSFIGAEQFFGPSSSWFDVYKSSFSFPLLLTISERTFAVESTFAFDT